MGTIASHCAAFVFALLMVCACQSLAHSVADTLVDRTDDTIESILENGTRDVEDSQFAEALLQLSANPIDLNTADAGDLQQIPGVDPILATRIVTYRKGHTFRSVEDLLLVEGMDGPLFMQIRDFVVVNKKFQDRDLAKGLSLHYTERTMTRLQDQRGYLDGTYVGNRYKIYNRLSIRYPFDSEFLIEGGGLTEKDPGEKDIADFSSGFLSVSNSRRSMKIILGDFVVEAGQGLTLWRSTGSTKGSEVIASVTKNPRGLQAYTSSDENGFLRGGGIQANWEHLDVTVFVSQKSVNATLNEEGNISSFDASGLSRTPTEIQKRSSSGERLLGMNADVRLTDCFRMGVRGYSTRFDNFVALTTMNGFRGQSASIGSIDYSYASGTVGSFGEVAVDHLRSVAAVEGVVLEPVPALDVALVLHSYPQRFVSLHGYGFGESGGQVQNDKGIYASARILLFPWFVVSTYFDQTSTLGASAISLLPVHGNELFGVFQLEPNDRTTFQLQVKQKNQADKQFVADPLSRSNAVIGRRLQDNYRASFEWRPSSRIRWKTRFEYVSVKYTLAGTGGRGLLFYQDVRLRPKSKLIIDGRIVVFDTDSYDSRIYEYESELRGTFANPALYGKGVRMYVLTRYEFDAFELTIKYSTTLKPGVKALGSGDSEIQGDADNQVSFQIDVTV